MLKYILVAITWFFILRSNAKRKGGFLNPSSFLLIIYMISFSFAIIHILYNGIGLAYKTKYWSGAIFALISLFIFFSPYCRFNESEIKKIEVPSRTILKYFSVFLIILSFYSLFYWLPYAQNVFLYRGVDLGDLRNDYVKGDFISGGGGFFQTIAGIGAHLYFFNIIMYFIYKSLGIYKTQQTLLLVSSFSYVIYVLSAVGRDGVVFWTFSFIACYLFFRKYLAKSSVKKITRLIYTALVVMLIPFFMISSGRFGGSLVGSIISYMGQSLPNFCFYFCSDNPPINYGSSFPYFCELLNIPYTSEYWAVDGTTSTAFGYFILNFYCSLGFWGYVVLETGIIILLFNIFKRNRVNMTFSSIILYFLFFQIFSQGVFYFRQYSAAGNILILISLIFYIVFSFVNNPLKIERKDA